MNTPNAAPYPYSLIATDLDGTILRSDGSISERTGKIVARLEGMGVTLVLVSARPPRVLERIARRQGFKGLAICCNGAIVYDLGSREIVQHNPLSYEHAIQVASALRNTLPGLSFAWERGLEFGCEPRFAQLHSFGAEEMLDQAELLALEDAPFTKLIVLDPDYKPDVLIDLLRGHAGPDVNLTHSGAPFIEISAKGVDKASALLRLAAELDVHPSRIIAFGDMPNDLPMLSVAGYSVAVANAHPSLLEHVDEVTLSNDRDGVAVVLERLFGLPTA